MAHAPLGRRLNGQGSPLIRLTTTAHVSVPPVTFAHLNDVVDCIWRREDLAAWECAKDDLIVELSQFKPHATALKQRAVFEWLKKLVPRIPQKVEYIIFREDK